MIDYQKILNKNLLNVFIDVLKNIESNGLDGKTQLYITFKTDYYKNIVPEWLLAKYPDEMTIVIQYEYYHLIVHESFFNIGLSFNNIKTDLKISFDSIISFADPSNNFGLTYQFIDSKKKKNEILKKNKNEDENSNIIKLTNFKKN